MTQIFRYVTKDKILDLTDMLSLEPKKNKIAITLLEYGEDFKARTTVHHYVGPDAFKVVCWEILSGTFTQWTDYKGSLRLSSGRGPTKEGKPEARVLSLRKDTRYRNPYVLRISRGEGEVIGAGAVKMVGKPTESLSILLPEFEAKRLALVTLDYIRAWEIIHFRERQRAEKG